ncbi:MAG TPA: hypothetical protein VEN29_05955 [Casimicrobiaceae bacterium]|nr:hypothetical protein [Casimicrobiaceae bacterium]
MIQALFLMSVIVGPLTLVAAIVIARMHWRLGIGPYREGYAFRVLARPSSYVQPDWIGSVRALALVGCCFIAVATGSLIYPLAVALAR